MSEEIEWIRADQVPARLNWPEDNYAHHAQLLDGLMSGRIKAKADRGVTVQIQKNNRGQLDVGAEVERDDWDDIPRSLWRDYVYHLHLRGRRYTYDLKPRGKFKEGDWLNVKLTGLWFSETDLLRELGQVPLVINQGTPLTALPERKGAAGGAIEGAAVKGKGGRKAARGWPMFAASLAEWVLNSGDDEAGFVEKGPDTILNNVLKLAQSRTDEELPRSTYQPAVQEFVDLMTQAARRK